ncbi:hypothetical protein PV10_09109 [Exophiala mesophila]|uniref:Uncharacterized protein n=1 Tax=Exophiala mesophila TaxID=212818 RepID=A0A0D1WHA1_EXOME|nr:uncharacterized protein PV10_09109 [Exophiala mesophila]KIV88190.1 hypothetical protein PV10_09109 [Exophiala mesophila]
MSTRPTDLILEHSCIFTGPQRRLSWHQDSLICSPDYYTLTTPDVYEPLLLHHVPSPSLCLDEMLRLWPAQDKKPSSHDVESSVSPPNDCRDSVATLVDFGSWVSRQSHDRRSSLLPPAPHWDRPDLEASSDSVECRLLSPETAPEGQRNRDHWRSSSPPFSKRSATPDQLGKLCVALENSSLFPKTASPVSTRTNTPVPSLSQSHCSVSTYSAVDAVSPEFLTDTNGKMSREHCHNRHDGSLQSATISCRASGFQDISPRTCSSRLEGTWSGLQLVSNHANRDLSSSLTVTDFGQRTGSLYPRAMPGQNLLSTSSSDPINHDSNPEVSYIDWDDDEEEERGQHRSRLARMKKSLTDLRNAERFISESVGRGNGTTKGYPGKTTALQSPHLGRSTIKAELNNHRAVALHPQHSRDQSFGKAHAHMMVNNTSNISSLKQETMDTCRTQAVSRATSVRERPAIVLPHGRVMGQRMGQDLAFYNRFVIGVEPSALSSRGSPLWGP